MVERDSDAVEAFGHETVLGLLGSAVDRHGDAFRFSRFDVDLMVDECLLKHFQAGASVVEDVRAGAEHDVVAADSLFKCEVDQGTQRLNIKAEIVDLTTHVVHTRFCVERNTSKPLSQIPDHGALVPAQQVEGRAPGTPAPGAQALMSDRSRPVWTARARGCGTPDRPPWKRSSRRPAFATRASSNTLNVPIAQRSKTRPARDHAARPSLLLETLARCARIGMSSASSDVRATPCSARSTSSCAALLAAARWTTSSCSRGRRSPTIGPGSVKLRRGASGSERVAALPRAARHVSLVVDARCGPSLSIGASCRNAAVPAARLARRTVARLPARRHSRSASFDGCRGPVRSERSTGRA